jgi:hypothetical protein
MSRETAFEKPASLGQLKEVVTTLVQAIPQGLSSNDAQHIIEDKGWLIYEVQKLFAWRRVQEHFDVEAHLAKARADMMFTDNVRGTAFQIEEWAQFYHEVFNLDVHFSTVKIPVRRSGFHRLIVVAQGLTLKHVIEVARKYFLVDLEDSGRYFSFDEETRGTHDRLPTQTYAVWVHDQIDSDAKYDDVRQVALLRRGVKCSTLLEHLLYHLKYFTETGKFLDRNDRQTVCDGSRDADGCIVAVFVKKSHRDGMCLGLGIGINAGLIGVREVNAQ